MSELLLKLSGYVVVRDLLDHREQPFANSAKTRESGSTGKLYQLTRSEHEPEAGCAYVDRVIHNKHNTPTSNRPRVCEKRRGDDYIRLVR